VAELRVVATAGHVDHGKSALIARLTGMDPDRWEEEKRRGLTIDLGYAWVTLPSGREVGFVDVPGHERFIGNMLAGVGPVRLVLFVVAADEGWKPQSEEHLEILDVLGVAGGVVALTKRDLVDAETLEIAEAEVHDRLAGTALSDAPIVPVSARTGDGMDELISALEAMLAEGEEPPSGRARLFVDRVFTIKGAGTVVTGTLAGDCLNVGDEVELLPVGIRARIRALQTHKQPEERACPVSRVAVNLAGAERQELARGEVLGRVGTRRATATFDAVIRPVRGLAHPVTTRGAFAVHAGSAEAGATLRFLGPTRLDPGGEAFVRVRLSHPMVLDPFDRFVLRDAGRQETVGGGTVLDPFPPLRPGTDAHLRLAARAGARTDDLPRLLTTERGAVRVTEALRLTGSAAPAPVRIGGWFVRDDLGAAVERSLAGHLEAFHALHPLEEGLPISGARDAVADALKAAGAPRDAGLIDTLLDDLAARGDIARSAATVRLPGHRVALDERSEEVDRLLAEVSGEREATPPTVKELQAGGLGRDVIEAAARAGVIVRVSPELVFTPRFVARAETVVREAGSAGLTVSAFRAALGTSRKFALPLLEWFDHRGITRREGDLRFPRDGSA
jgi:selenocysteine-specific elongation factor